MLKIGEFSKLAQVSVKTLRYYDELGLLRAEWVDRYTSYRYYTLQQLPRLNRILALRELGFSLVQIARLLREDLPASELQRLMKLRQAELTQQLQEEQARLARVAARLRQIEQEGRQPRYEVLVKRVQPRLVAGIRDTLADPRDIGSLLDELRSYLRDRGVAPDPLAPGLAIFYDAEFLDRGADVEVAVPLDGRLRGSARVAVHELPAVADAASVIHAGSYDRIAGAYRALIAWAQANGYRAGGPNREIYLHGPESASDPNSYVTELQLPIAPVSAHFALPGAAGQPSTHKERQIMEPRIVTKPAFTVVGLPFTGFISNAPYEEGKSNNEIGLVWDEFNRRAGEIQNICGPAYGLCFGMPNDREPWYIAGFEVSRAENIPAGMMSMSVPAQKYAIFPCTLGALGATYRYITEEWQPQSGAEHADAPDFELYDEEPGPGDPREMKLSVYWPIK
jgi:predicted transcriptional regulator YdeE/DNA-binding transcriptional MerR regulator